MFCTGRKCAAFGAWASYGHDRLWFRKYYRQCCANFADYQILFFNAMLSILYHFFDGSCLHFFKAKQIITHQF
ncbi:hypothetical protein HMPREF9530_00499 [Escherichia coli MS 21-1]|nr:hypothetical protein HMPREF9530_00499 [Escherichia coli MS 21-1]